MHLIETQNLRICCWMISSGRLLKAARSVALSGWCGDSVSGGFALGASFSFTSIDVYENLSFRMEPVIFSVG